MAMSEAELKAPEWTLGDRMAKARRAAGLEQEEMARLLGKSRAVISKWERDQGQPRDVFALLRRWAEITEVPVQWLLGVGSTSLNFETPRLRLLQNS